MHVSLYLSAEVLPARLGRIMFLRVPCLRTGHVENILKPFNARDRSIFVTEAMHLTQAQ